jgi:trigger factor
VTESCVKFEDESQIKKKMYFEVPWSDVEKELNKVYENLKKTAKIKGFRQGKIPRNILEVYFKDNAENDAAANIIAKHYQDVMEAKKFRPAGYPKVDHKGLTKDEPFAFNLTIEVEPVFEPKDYIGMELEKADPEVTDEAVDKKIEKLRHFYSYMEDVTEDRGIAKGDFTCIAFEGKLDGQAMKEMTSDNYFLEVGSGQFIEEFEEKIMGMKRDETRIFMMTFPDTYHVENIAGKEVEFSVTLKDQKIRKLPELDENFIKNFEKFSTMDELRAQLRQELAVELESKSKLDLQEEMVSRLIQNNEVEVPANMLQHQVDQMVFEAANRWTSNGIPKDKAKEMAEKMQDNFRADAEKIVKAQMILKAIGVKENITVETAEIDEKIKILAGQYGQDFEGVKKRFEDANMMEGIENELLTKKIIAFIESKSIINTVKKEINV